MNDDEKEAIYWLNELRLQLINRLDDVNTALDKLSADAMFEVATTTTDSLNRTMSHLGVCVARMDESKMALPDFVEQFEKA